MKYWPNHTEIVNDNINVNNVIAAIKSPDVMAEVVDRLDLDVSYTTQGTFYDKTLYGKSLPVKVVFRDLGNDDTASLHISLNGKGGVKMSDFVKNGKPQHSPDLTCNVGQTVSTPLGRLTLERQANYASAVADNDEIDVTKTTNRAATGRFTGGLTVEIGDKKSTILDLSYKDVSGRRAEDILNAVIDIYNKVWMKNRNEVAAGATRFLDERLAIIERELDEVDTDISKYKSDNLLPDIKKAYSLSMERSDKNSAMMLELNTQLSVAGYVRDFIAARANTNQLIPANVGLDNDKIDALVDKYNALQLERNQLIANSGAGNPLIKDMDKSLAQLRRSVLNSINNLMVSLSTHISHLERRAEDQHRHINQPHAGKGSAVSGAPAEGERGPLPFPFTEKRGKPAVAIVQRRQHPNHKVAHREQRSARPEEGHDNARSPGNRPCLAHGRGVFA